MSVRSIRKFSFARVKPSSEHQEDGKERKLLWLRISLFIIERFRRLFAFAVRVLFFSLKSNRTEAIKRYKTLVRCRLEIPQNTHKVFKRDPKGRRIRENFRRLFLFVTKLPKRTAEKKVFLIMAFMLFNSVFQFNVSESFSCTSDNHNNLKFNVVGLTSGMSKAHNVHLPTQSVKSRSLEELMIVSNRFRFVYV